MGIKVLRGANNLYKMGILEEVKMDLKTLIKVQEKIKKKQHAHNWSKYASNPNAHGNIIDSVVEVEKNHIDDNIQHLLVYLRDKYKIVTDEEIQRFCKGEKLNII